MSDQEKIEQVENEFISRIREKLEVPARISGEQHSSVMAQDVNEIWSSLITPSTPRELVKEGVRRAIMKLEAQGVRYRADRGFSTWQGKG